MAGRKKNVTLSPEGTQKYNGKFYYANPLLLDVKHLTREFHTLKV